MRAVVRGLRDWLDGLLEDTWENGGGEDQPAQIASPPTVAQDGGVSAGREPSPDISPWNALRRPGPPEDWLRRVRDGAPELLRSIDASETLSVTGAQSTSHRVEQSESVNRNEVLEQSAESEKRPANVNSSSTAPAPKLERLSGGESRVDRRVGKARAGKTHAGKTEDKRAEDKLRSTFEPVPPSLGKTAARSASWFRRSPRESKPNVVTANAEKEEEVTMERQKRRSSPTSERLRQEPTAVVKDKAIEVESQQQSIAAFPGTADPARWQANSVHTANNNTANNNEERTNNQGRIKDDQAVAESRNPAHAPHPDSSVSAKPLRFAPEERVPLETPASRMQAHGQNDRSPREFRPLGRARADGTQFWPPAKTSAPSSIDEPFRTQMPVGVESEFSRTAPSSHKTTDAQPLVRSSMPSARWPESESGDPWPALPEHSPIAAADWPHLLSAAERLRELDLEQRGGH